MIKPAFMPMTYEKVKSGSSFCLTFHDCVFIVACIYTADDGTDEPMN